MDSPKEIKCDLYGEIGDRVKAVIDQWILPLVKSNPAILEMFRERDIEPLRNMSPWEGEFAGKYLTHCVQIFRLTRSDILKEHIQWFVDELISLQAEDGYLGPWPKDSRLTGKASNCNIVTLNKVLLLPTWDAWGHYHIMLGLLYWYQESRDPKVLACVCRIADLFCRLFLFTSQHVYSISPGYEEMNMACIHAFCLLYEVTGVERYLELVRQIEKDLETPPCGDHIRAGLEGKDFYKGSKPRWESLHIIQGIAELYYITGEERYRKAFENTWWSIVRTDRHNTGGFSSGEKAVGNPYDNAAPIETCGTIAWMAVSVDMLKITGNSIIADEIELSLMNAGLASLSKSGRWCTYNTPMDGDRRAFFVDYNFQARPGSPELSCCAVNAPRCLGMISDWAVMEQEDGLALNYFGQSTIQTRSPAGNWIVLTQQTEYPASGRILITLDLESAEVFDLRLRIPQWSKRTVLAINGQTLTEAKAGEYSLVRREWKTGDVIDLTLDMSLHYWIGEGNYEGKGSIYRGPILMSYDPRFRRVGMDAPLELDVARIYETRTSHDTWLKPWLLFEYLTEGGKKLVLCDFASAGSSGSQYMSWFRLKNVKKTEFSQKNTFRSSFVASMRRSQ
jgi:uncharacterized protein